jgi:hypothetical protein
MMKKRHTTKTFYFIAILISRTKKMFITGHSHVFNNMKNNSDNGNILSITKSNHNFIFLMLFHFHYVLISRTSDLMKMFINFYKPKKKFLIKFYFYVNWHTHLCFTHGGMIYTHAHTCTREIEINSKMTLIKHFIGHFYMAWWAIKKSCPKNKIKLIIMAQVQQQGRKYPIS